MQESKPQARLAIEMVPLEELRMYEGNAKLHDAAQIEQIAESIEDFQFSDPIGAWHDDDGSAVIVEGHGRYLAAARLGIEELPVIFLDHLTDEERRSYGLVHNQLTMNSGFDVDALGAELESIATIDMEKYGFIDAEEMGLEELPDSDEPEPVADGDHGTEVRLGDRWVLGDHVLVCGDSTVESTYELLMGAESADLLLTDPPYGVAYVGKTADAMTIENDEFDDDSQLGDFLYDAMLNALMRTRGGGAYYMWFATCKTSVAYGVMDRLGVAVRQELYWIKNVFTLGHQDYHWQTEPCLYGWKDGAPHYFAPTRKERNILGDALSDVDSMTEDELRDALRDALSGSLWETDAIRQDKPLASELHPTMKPVDLFERLIRNSSRRGEIVLDPFGGSGTTIIACERMGRRARLIELDPEYCSRIISRWEDMTGREAVLSNGEDY